MGRRDYRTHQRLSLLLLCCVFTAQAPAHNVTRASRSHRHRGLSLGPSQKPSHHGEQQALARSTQPSDGTPVEPHQPDPQQPQEHQQEQVQQQQLSATWQGGAAGWEGGAFWMEEHRRTLYFEPLAGLGNRLRALASAIVVARSFGVGFKMVWKSEPACDKCKNYAAFVSTWDDLFVEPVLPRADNFPGTNTSQWGEANLERFADGRGPGGHPPDNCTIHITNSYDQLAAVLTNGWETVQGQEVVCAKGTSWLTQRGEYDAAPFFAYLRPAPVVKAMIDTFKASVQWDTTQWICTHVRRTDLQIHNNDTRSFAAEIIQLGGYTRVIKALLDLATVDQDTRVFLATDDASAEKEIREVFEEGRVVSYPKADAAWSRGSVEGIQAALADILLLSSCPVLVGTFYSSYSETAKLMGRGFYVQVGGELGKTSSVRMQEFMKVRNSTFHDRTL